MSALLERPEVAAMARRFSRAFVTELVREAVTELRSSVASGEARLADVEAFASSLGERLEAAVARRFGGRVTPVINATGVIVHTNLGRSRWAKVAVERAAAAAAEYCDLEYDLKEGERGSRLAYVESLLGKLFPGRAGIAVNNNAGAVLLSLNTLAEGREVLISRGELVEIGGSFRIPDVMAKSGALMREVGTTNRTRLADFEKGLSDRTGLMLKVHTSNFRILGFAEEAPLADLASLAARAGLPLLVDQGSGNLLDLSPWGLRDEPPVSRLLAEGADVVCFSGDKLLGGPQAGILVGREDLVARMKKNPIYRAVRPDKSCVAALEATLEIFVSGDPLSEIPTLRMLSAPASEMQARAERIARGLSEAARDGVEIEVIEGASMVGGGSAPGQGIPTALVALRPAGGSAAEYERALRTGRHPVVARVQEGRLLIDPRTVDVEEEVRLIAALEAAISRG